ncbi:MAG: anti-sigma factor [Burkholderiales bacterium]|nr:anti-sigma factor [Burkholderiales bacterium]
MSDARISEADLQAYVDGRLAEPRRAEVEAELAASPELVAHVEACRAQSEALRGAFQPVLEEPIPVRLLDATRPPARRGVAIAAGVLCALLGGAAGWAINEMFDRDVQLSRAQAPLPLRAAVAHAVYSPEVRHPVEVGADQEAHLVAWLSKRLGAPVRAPKLDSEGYRLMGGRLLPGESGPVAHFMYQCEKGTRVTLYVRTEAPDHEETAFRYADQGNVRVFYWIDRTFGYALSSADIDRERLLRVANAAYRQLNP